MCIRDRLIDGLSGVGSLKAFVRELTDLPVEVVNTHGHVAVSYTHLDVYKRQNLSSGQRKSTSGG